MSTKSLVDFCVPFALDWGRSGTHSILSLAREAQDELWDKAGAMAHWVGSDNDGWPPYLQTQAGVTEYEIIAENLSVEALTVSIGGADYPVRARRVLKVFADVGQNLNQYGRRYIGRPYMMNAPNPYTTARNRLSVADVPVDMIPAGESTPARIRFKEDPKATTQTYFCLFAWEPPRLLTERVPLVVSVEWERAMRDYIIGTIETYSSGKQSDRLTKWEEYWVPKFEMEFAPRAAAEDDETPIRIC
jgi:hypothetical protein